MVIHRHWGGRRVSHAAHTSRHSSQFGVGLRALGPWGSSGDAEGSRSRWIPVTAVTCCVCRKDVHPVPRHGRQEGGAGHGCCPVWVGGGDPQDPLRVPAGRDYEEEQGGARALLPQDLSPVLGTSGPGEGGGQVRAGPPAGCVHRRREGVAPGGLPRERLAHDGVRRVRPGIPVRSGGDGWAPRPRLPRIL